MSAPIIDMSDDFDVPMPTHVSSTSSHVPNGDSSSSSSPAIVVIGSMERIEEYQALLMSLRHKFEKDGQNASGLRGEMVDRLVQGATTLPAQVQYVHLVTPLSSIASVLPYLPTSTPVHIHLPTTPPPPSTESSHPDPESESITKLREDLAGRGYLPIAVGVEKSDLPVNHSSIILSYRTPATAVSAPLTFSSEFSSGLSTPASTSTPPSITSTSTATATTTGAIRLPKRSSATSRAKKASIWVAHTSPAIQDPSSLLTEADKTRPVCVFPDAADSNKPIKRRRACKDCSCGLADLEKEEEEAAKSNAFYLEGDDDIPSHIKEATIGVERIWPEEKRDEAKKTSSCGSCYLGDAFRCGSCPYLGLPAFEPGQKVEISAAMDDI